MDFATSFAKLPIENFVDLVDAELRRLKNDVSVDASSSKKVIVIGCHPRCGGTLLTQLFESDTQLQKDGVVIINEPHSFHRCVWRLLGQAKIWLR